MGVVERGPVTDRPGQRGRVLFGHLRAEFGAEFADAAGQDVGVQVGRMLGLGACFVRRERGQQRLVIQGEAAPVRPGPKHGRDAGLPIDQGAVAVEAERVEVVEVHGFRSLIRSRKNSSAVSRWSCQAASAGRM